LAEGHRRRESGAGGISEEIEEALQARIDNAESSIARAFPAGLQESMKRAGIVLICKFVITPLLSLLS